MLFSTALLALAATAVSAITPLEIKGQDFVDEDGNKFQIVGMAYQPGGSAGYNPETGEDPLSHPEQCKRDAALMQILGINAIRVYNLDPNINHDACASIFNAAGMYMMIDVNSPLPGEAIASEEPWTTYHVGYLNRTFAIVEAFSNYPNTLLFFSANEVIEREESAEFAPQYLRAVTRDLKNYIKNNIKRKIPVGYSAADVRDMLWDTWNYLQCTNDDEDDDMSRADLFALNSYSWCGDEATFETSTFDKLVEGFKNSSVPIFFSEYGCNEAQPRAWTEIASIYGSDMKGTFSGGVVYEYTMEPNNYGLVNISGDSLTILSDFNRLKDKLADVNWSNLQSEKSSGSTPRAPKCSSSLIQQDIFDSNFTLPNPPPGAQELIDDGIDPKPRGRIIDIDDYDVTLEVLDPDGDEVTDLKVVPVRTFNMAGENEHETGTDQHKSSENHDGEEDDDDDDDSNSNSSDNSDEEEDEDDAAVLTRPIMWAVALPLVAMLFA